jgi:uncharacterized protein
LEEVGLSPEKIQAVKFDPVIKPPEDPMYPMDYRGGCMSINEPWIAAADAFLREEILKRGYRTSGPQPVICMVELRDSHVVHFDGVLYKCPAFIGRKGFEAGDLWRGVTDCASAYCLGLWQKEPCSECEYLPLCFGGCRYMAYVKEGRIDRPDCRKAYLDSTLETLVKQNMRYRSKEQHGR